MSDTSKPEPTQSMAERVEQLTETLSNIVLNEQSIHEDVQGIKDRTTEDAAQRRQNRRTSRAIVVLAALSVVALIALIILTLDFHHQVVAARHEQTQSSVVLQAVLAETAHRNEVERLVTEIQVSTAKGDTVAVQVRQQRLAQEEAILKQYDNAIAQLLQGKEVPLPADTPIPSGD